MNNYILYFVGGKVPTNDEFKAAEQFMNKGPILRFVSLVDIDLNEGVIDNVGVAGKVPEVYKNFVILDEKPAVSVIAPPPPAPNISVGKNKADK
jgi:hypothetical protein